MSYSSKLLENAVNALSTLPGIGKKTALRLALHLAQQPVHQVEAFGEAIVGMRQNIKTCHTCHNLSDTTTCMICADDRRNKQLICVVESVRDVMAIESTSQFNGVYHVLGGVISPIDGIGPEQLNIDSLIQRATKEDVELIMAVSPTIEGETTIYYLSKQLKDTSCKISTIARGVSFGGELEYADELTLGRSILSRVPYKNME